MRVIRIRIEQFDKVIGDDSSVFFQGVKGRFMFLLFAAKPDEKEETLLFGDTQNHMQLLQLAELDPGSDAEQRKRYLTTKARINETIDGYKARALGGGICDADGNVVDWRSNTFGLETAEEWRKPIERALQAASRATDPEITLP
jgi:hypothetical protein